MAKPVGASPITTPEGSSVLDQAYELVVSSFADLGWPSQSPSSCQNQHVTKVTTQAGQPVQAVSSLKPAWRPMYGAQVEYRSASQGGWIPCVVTHVHQTGFVQVSIRPGSWIAPEDQHVKLRPARNTAALGTQAQGRMIASHPQATTSALPMQWLYKSPPLPGNGEGTLQLQTPSQLSGAQLKSLQTQCAYTAPKFCSGFAQTVFCTSTSPSVRRIGTKPRADGAAGRLSAVIVTICAGQSYDEIFQQVSQEGPRGTRVSTYSVTGASVSVISRALQGRPGDVVAGEFAEMLADIRAVEPASVVFNWECCSGCQQETFGAHRQGTIELMHTALHRGHMVMCSDFSLKALIKEWSEDAFGPNPFVKLGGFSGSFRLSFDCETLKACPSAQLQKVAEMSELEHVHVGAMSDTIAYTVDTRRTDTDRYTLEVLTVATEMPAVSLNLPQHLLCRIGDYFGAAGHVMLTYPSGGLLLASSGHWIELLKLDVSEARLLEVATTSYGASYARGIESQLAACRSAPARQQLTSSLASQYVQQSSPCTYTM